MKVDLKDRVHSRFVHVSTETFLKEGLKDVHFLWQLYYNRPIEDTENNFQDWLINLTPEAYEQKVREFEFVTGWGEGDY